MRKWLENGKPTLPEVSSLLIQIDARLLNTLLLPLRDMAQMSNAQPVDPPSPLPFFIFAAPQP
jgi:hypothetical protein